MQSVIFSEYTHKAGYVSGKCLNNVFLAASHYAWLHSARNIAALCPPPASPLLSSLRTIGELLHTLNILYFQCVLSQWVTHQSGWPWGSQLAQCGPGWRSGWKNESASLFCCLHEKERQQGYSCFWIQETGKIQQEEEGKRNKYDFRIWPDSQMDW